MKKLLQILYANYVFVIFVILETCGFLMVINYNTYQQITYLSWLNEISGVLNQNMSEFTRHFEVIQDNELLRKENLYLRDKLSDAYLNVENTFTPWTDTTTQQNYVFRKAEVISNELSKQDNYLMINKGHTSGIGIGMGVINATGVVGIVTDVSAHYAVIMSILNSKFKIGVRLKTSPISV